MNSFPRYVLNVFAARAVDQQHRAKGGMHSGLMTSPCVMIVPNSLLKVCKVVILYRRSFLSCLSLSQPVRVGRGLAWHLSLAQSRQQCRLVMIKPESAHNSSKPGSYVVQWLTKVTTALLSEFGLSACKYSAI